MTISKAIGAIASVLGICVITFFAIDYGVLDTETGFMRVLEVVGVLGGYSVYQVTKK